MFKPFALLTALLLLAAPVGLFAETLPLNKIIYENDFSTRTSSGPIAGSTVGTYTTGNLAGTAPGDVGQDGWQRPPGTVSSVGRSQITVSATGSNQFVRIGTTTVDQDHLYVAQKIGRTATHGPLRISIDMLPTNAWRTSGTSHGLGIMLGGDALHDSRDSNNVTAYFGLFAGPVATDGTTRIAVRDGTGQVSDTWIGSDFVAADNDNQDTWYRFIVDLDLDLNTWSLDAYELGTDHPTMSTPLGNLVYSIDDLGFRTNVGPDGVKGITTIGVFGRRLLSGTAGFDNIVISIPEPGSLSLLALAGLCLVLRRRRRSHSGPDI